MEKQKEIQEKYMEMQMLHQQLKQSEQQLQATEMQVAEFESLKESLDEFSRLGKGQEILAQLHPGIFLKANLSDNRILHVNVGSDVNVERTIPETKKIIDAQMKTVSRNREILIAQFQQMAERIGILEEELSKLV